MMYGDWYEHQGHPHHHHIHGDMEPAFVVRPGDDCCPEPTAQQCECVTSGDIIKWDTAADTLEGLTGVDFDKAVEALEKIDVILTSSDSWNSAYNTLSANSADWLKSDDLTALSANVKQNTNDIAELSASLSSTDNRIEEVAKLIPDLHFEKAPEGPFYGDGSVNSPYTIKDWPTIKNLKSAYNDLNSHLAMHEITAVEYTAFKPGEEWGTVSPYFTAYPAESYFMTDGAAAAYNRLQDQYGDIAVSLASFNSRMDWQWNTIIAELAKKADSNGVNTYIGGDGIDIYETDVPTVYGITVTAIPEKYKQEIDKGLEALDRVAVLEAKSYVEFAKVPTITGVITEEAIKNYKAADTIYYC